MVAELPAATANQLPDWSGLCLAITGHAPLPMAAVGGASHIVRHVNPAFCRLMAKPTEQLVGKPFHQLLPEEDECVALLDRVFRTGKPESYTEQGRFNPHPVFWSYTMWPVLADECLVGVMIQVTETTQFHEKTLAMNEALMVGSVRQHELTEEADSLNAQLRTEITERKRAELELVAAKNEISRHAVELEETVTERTAQLRETIGELEAFSYSISHDMRAPLRAMRGFAGILLTKHAAQLDAEGIKYLEKINAAAGRMDALIQDVLTYTRVLRAEIKIKPVDLDVLVRQVIGIYPQLQTGNAEIQIEGVLAKVLGGEASLAQCLSNLLTNAVKFVAPGTKPHVKVWAEEIQPKVESRESRARDAGALDPRPSPRGITPAPLRTDSLPAISRDEALDSPTVRLWVEDNGVGIAPEDQVRIFKMFERVHRATAYEGTGMGLAIVRKAVERMGGQMGVESEVGQGSKFWIQLKVANPGSSLFSVETNAMGKTREDSLSPSEGERVRVKGGRRAGSLTTGLGEARVHLTPALSPVGGGEGVTSVALVPIPPKTSKEPNP
jgi:signal transduction histidine kinase